MKKLSCALALMIFVTLQAKPQKHLVRFTDKSHTTFSLAYPSAYLSQRSIDRRSRYNISIDSTDLPVSTAYLDSLRSIPGVTVLNVSKWLNQVSIQVADLTSLNKITLLPFVKSATPLTYNSRNKERSHIASFGKQTLYKPIATPLRQDQVSANFFDYGNTFNQINIHNGEFLHNIGLRGQDMVIGILDAGYQNFHSLRAFDSVNTNGQVLGTWDFISNNSNVADDNAHGMQCFSIIAGNIPGIYVGTAPKASFYLFRTENSSSEYPVEEHDWVCAAEHVDSVGGDIVSSSLGYTRFDKQQYSYSYDDMNGNTSMVAKGADLAAQKGIIVVNAAGNEGTNSWKYISTPADGDSVLAVGAVNSSGQPASFSSYGPSADGQVKPDVAAVGAGTWVQLTNNNFGTGNGTSFACPLMAGLAACLWQGFQELNNMAIINALRQAGNNVNTPNTRIGYGIPDVRKAMGILLKQVASVNASFDNCRTTIRWTSKDVAAMKYEVERKTSSDSIFFKIADITGIGKEFSTNNYEFTDILTKVEVGQVFYRIRQIIDTNATNRVSVYLDTAVINAQSSCMLTGKINVFPNPTQGKFTIQTAFEEAVTNLNILVYNASGQLLVKRKENKPSGVYNYIIEVPQLAMGKYYVSIYKDKELIETKELVVTR
jgi:serine protease AprX